MPEKEKGLIEIQRQRDVTQQLYQYLLQKKQETLIATQTASADNHALVLPPFILLVLNIELEIKSILDSKESKE